jgi:N-acetylmuramoyl-L-alanine amidase
MTFKIAGCAGHGFNTPGKRTPDDEREWSFNNEVIVTFEEALSQYEDVEFLRTDDRTGKTDVPLKTRTDKANNWKADIYISFHHNANTGKWGSWTGTETYTYLGSNPKSEKLASMVHPRIVKVYGLKDRGMKKANFHIVRESHMPSILIEGCYMDSTIDIVKLRDHNVLKSVGYAVAEGVAEYAGLKKKIINQSPPIPKVETKPQPTQPKKEEYKPVPKPSPKKKYVVLPANATSWAVYPLNKAPIKKNAKAYINPKKFHGLTYEVLGNPQADVYTIQTDSFGKVNIYASNSTGAKIILK